MYEGKVEKDMYESKRLMIFQYKLHFLDPSLPSQVLMSCQLLMPVAEVGGRDHMPMMRMLTPVPNLLLLSNPGPLRLIYPIAMMTAWRPTIKVEHIYN